MAEQTKKAQNIWQKLFEIQKSIKSFAVKEDSDKTDSSGKPSYRYTPGWEIIERIREEMDSRGIMLLPNCVSRENKLIEYLVYKMIGGKPMSFPKKEMYVELAIEFTWMDTETGETAGPYTGFGFGANGTDKSGATAMSMAKRYFLLNFFNFTTREITDEQDAHDMGNIPGVPQQDQFKNLSPNRIPEAVPAPSFNEAGMQPSAPAAYPSGQPFYCPVAPQFPQPQYPPYQGGAQQPQGFPFGQPSAPQAGGQQAPLTPNGEFDANHPAIRAAINDLVFFEKGTPQHQRVLNESIGKLASIGFKCMNKDFLEKLVSAAEDIRKGK